MSSVSTKTDAGGREAFRPRPIFRTAAVRRYTQNHQKTTLPRFVCPRAFLYLWILLGFLFVAGILVGRHSGMFEAGPVRGGYR